MPGYGASGTVGTTTGKSGYHPKAGARCAQMARARTAVTTVMASSSETELKEKRRKAARTLLSKDWEYEATVDEAARGPKPYRRAHDKRIPAERRRHLVDGVYVDKLPFNAGEQLRIDPYPDLSTAGLIASNQYDSSHSGGRKPVIIAEQVEPAVKKQTWCEWVFSCHCTRDN